MAKKGFTRVKAPKGVVALSVDGVEYTVDLKTGMVDVSDLHVAEAAIHGFVVVPQSASE